MTAAPGEPAVKTHYGAAVTTLSLEGLGPDAEIAAVLEKILLWYAEHPQWSFGGIDAFEMSGDTCCAVLYAGASVRGSRRFFTMKEENGKAEVDKVYSVLRIRSIYGGCIRNTAGKEATASRQNAGTIWAAGLESGIT